MVTLELCIRPYIERSKNKSSFMNAKIYIYIFLAEIAKKIVLRAEKTKFPFIISLSILPWIIKVLYSTKKLINKLQFLLKLVVLKWMQALGSVLLSLNRILLLHFSRRYKFWRKYFNSQDNSLCGNVNNLCKSCSIRRPLRADRRQLTAAGIKS